MAAILDKLPTLIFNYSVDQAMWPSSYESRGNSCVNDMPFTTELSIRPTCRAKGLCRESYSLLLGSFDITLTEQNSPVQSSNFRFSAMGNLPQR